MNWAFGGARGTKPNVEAIVSGLYALIDSLPSELELPPEARASVEDSAAACDNAEGNGDDEACDNAEANDDVDHNGGAEDNLDIADAQPEKTNNTPSAENADDEAESAESVDTEPAEKTPADTESAVTESVDTASVVADSSAEASDELPIEPKPVPVPQETSRTTSAEDTPADIKTSRQNKGNSKRADLDGTMKLPRSRRIR